MQHWMNRYIVSLVMCVFFASTAHAEPDPADYSFAQFQIFAIADKLAESKPEVFEADAELLAQYLQPGKAPASFMAFLVGVPGGLALIDTGFGNQESKLMEGLSAAGVKPEDISHVLLTHMHMDHIGGLAWEGAPAFPNAQILVAKAESDFWQGEEASADGAPTKANADLAKKLIAMYKDRVTHFAFGDTVLSNITAMDASGHTPGHTAYLLESKNQRLLFVGDLLHSTALQMPRPDIVSIYDMDKEKTAATRKRVLSYAAERNIPLAGQHFPFAAVGNVKAEGEGFVYTPLDKLE
ncbi:MBL fold metallo-hydrolase [Desulfovibrio sp. OttesenSCG-928-G15]|nr:MBL fold metallo-hydrolase [Desulfovibrio sp. OttesenSCG-928-G15]